MTGLELAEMPEGSFVEDSVGDIWCKEGGVWVCRDATLSNESLLHVWGPVELWVGEV